MKKLWMAGMLCITMAILLLLVPNTTAGAAASDFQMEGTTLVNYTGTATTVSVPANVETIGRSAFENNKTIKKITISDNVTTIEEYAFWGCDSLESVVFGKGLAEISDFAFTKCKNLKEVYIPDTIQRIGIMAFAECQSLQDIKIPVSVTDIHETAFEHVPNLNIVAEMYSYPYRYAMEREERLAKSLPQLVVQTPLPEEPQDSYVEVWIPAATPTPTPAPTGTCIGSTSVVGNQAVVFMDNTELEAMDADAVDLSIFSEKTPVETQIEDWQFYKDATLKHMELAENTTKIGEFAFARSSLQSIRLSEETTTIDYAAFYHCDNLREVYIPNSVTKIEEKAFFFTPWLKSFYEGSTDVAGDSDFLIVGDGILLAYRGEEAVVHIPYGVKHIAAEAFLNHDEIEDVRIPSTVISMDSAAFRGCTYNPVKE